MTVFLKCHSDNTYQVVQGVDVRDYKIEWRKQDFLLSSLIISGLTQFMIGQFSKKILKAEIKWTPQGLLVEETMIN